MDMKIVRVNAEYIHRHGTSVVHIPTAQHVAGFGTHRTIGAAVAACLDAIEVEMPVSRLSDEIVVTIKVEPMVDVK